MTAAPADVRAAFDVAADAFVATVATIEPDRLDGPATSAWTVRELVAHTARALLATESTILAEVDPGSRRLASAAHYFVVAMGSAGVHQGIEARARQGVAALGDDPGAAVREIAARVAPLVAATADDHVVQHAAGQIAFIDYLATRVVELVLHTVDLQGALDRPIEAPPDAAAVARDVIVAVSGRADALTVACVLTGRPSPAACNVLG